MAHFCGFTKLIFLLLMLVRISLSDTRPLKGNAQRNSDLIAGNEFLKLFMEREQLESGPFSNEYVGGGGGSVDQSHKRKELNPATNKEESYDKKSTETGRRSNSGRSLKDTTPLQNQAEGQLADSKQVVKLVTSGSKIVFLEDYDENDAILDAEVRDIDLKKEKFKNKSNTNLDDYKVVAVSVSSSSQRGSTTAKNHSKSLSTTTKKPSTTTTTTTTKTTTRVASRKTDNIAADNFINRSHKSEFSIEEVEPLTTAQHKGRKTYTRQRPSFSATSVADTLEALDSENSASTNIQNILAAPSQPATSARSTSTVTSTYHSNQRNMTINHKSNNSETQHMVSGIEDQLLPFQTVIYHDTKAGHGPQSRSISYSSISQNVEDLKKWHQSGILAEARRNVSESLKPMLRSNISMSQDHTEPAKFYSQPSKMYSEPSKFYSEPAKVYSEPAKVYGEPEKFYSEPAKVYGQPSKFYSEPSKVYSQPSKVYSEPAKTYWPLTATTTAASTGVTTLIAPTNAPYITTTMPPMVNILNHASRKPAIVSRIAFGEAHSTSTSTTTTSSSTMTTSTTSAPLTTTTSRTYGTHNQHHYTRSYSSGHRNALHSPFNNENSSLSSSLSSSTPSRRILFNLDRLPYDLLNAPESSIQQQQQQHQQQLLQQQKLQRPQQTLTYNQHQLQEQQKQQRHNINPCLESAVSSLFSSSSLSAHPALVKQRQQTDSQQHSNQNAKGLPNGDLVRCVAEISHTSSATADDGTDGIFTTERSHMEELFTPTPEQNYEIEESVSVMTNGRSHSDGLHGGRNSFTQPTISPLDQQPHHGFKPNRQRTRIHFGTKVDQQQEGEVQQNPLNPPHYSQLPYNSNFESGNRHNSHAPDYRDNGGDEGEEDDGSYKNNDYENDDGSEGKGSPTNGNNGDDEDSKVAYVVEGRNYRKYRVEEKTDDGFIVGEYGVVDHNDGNLRGVRYTADSTINPSLIQKALLTFLKLK